MRASTGVHFAVWAPNARRVSVVGDFNAWDGRRHQMRKRIDSGLWEIFAPDIGEGAVYKFEIIGRDGALLPLKADPFGFAAELRPSTASVVARTDNFAWTDARMARAPRRGAIRGAQPMAIYEVHLGSWRRGERRQLPDLRRARRRADSLRRRSGLHPSRADADHRASARCVLGLPADRPVRADPALRRSGRLRALRRSRPSRPGLGVILDWVPAHFPTDVHGLAHFDGTALYEHADPRRGFHPDWNTAIYDFGRREVANFLIASALYWLDRFHIDGLRVDAVASMLYLDYSRQPGEWTAQRRGRQREPRRGRLPARAQHAGLCRPSRHHDDRRGIDRLARRVAARPMPAASASASSGTWAGCTTRWTIWRTTRCIGAGTTTGMTFGLLYAFTENFVLPLSHDEVVHGKGSILGRMPGDEWQRFANLRAYYALHVGLSRQEAAVHGPGIRPARGMELRRAARLASAGRTPLHRGRAATACATSTGSIAASRRCTPATARPRASAGSSSMTPSNRSSPGCGWARRAIRRSPWSAISRRCRATATASACRTPALARDAQHRRAAVWRLRHRQSRPRQGRRQRRRTACRPRPSSPCRRSPRCTCAPAEHDASRT